MSFKQQSLFALFLKFDVADLVNSAVRRFAKSEIDDADIFAGV